VAAYGHFAADMAFVLLIASDPIFLGDSTMTNDELREIRRGEFRAIREELDLNQTDFGALLGRKRGMIKNYENGYPIPEMIMEAARCLQANPPPRAPDPASRGRGRPRGHANRPRCRGDVAWDDSESLASEGAAVAISPWFWIGLAVTVIALVILWNAPGNRLNLDPDPVAA
jgi:DNA-binding transcriptional regulator YiaG